MSGKSSLTQKNRRQRQIEFLSEDLLTCKPLDTYNAILKFLENPPPWRTLCEELRPHSKYYVTNMDNFKGYQLKDIMLETVSDYCHFDPDEEDPGRDDGTEKARPKTLVCHDMANGYHDDSHIDGTVNYHAYTFYNWAGIDIFCYFSHHLITIPPLGWINVAHAHGVKIIGTIITEWAEGSLFWDEILESEAKYQQFADAVVAIAKTLKFDGWLLNIENKVSKPDVLLRFVKHLHKLLHSELVDPVLIWYDSVTVDGKLHWQNKLNEKNKAFFNACDGFFVNYSWSAEDIESSMMAAGSRVTDLYIGIDIWGRNFYCGGQFNSYEAIKIAYNEGCSLAIFAPAWTHEAITTDPSDSNYVVNGERLNMMSIWQLRDRALWASMWPYLHTRLPCHLPFQTSFCRGQGKKRWQYGEVISPGPWYNLRLQQYQANSIQSQHGYMLTPFEGPKRERVRSKDKDTTGIIKTSQTAIEQQQTQPKEKDTTDTIKTSQTAIEQQREDAPNPDKKFPRLKVVDSLQRMAHENVESVSTPIQRVETKPIARSVMATVSKQPAPSQTPSSKPILKKKSLCQRILGIFKKDSNPPIEIKKEAYKYEDVKVVALSKVDNSLPGTSTARRASIQSDNRSTKSSSRELKSSSSLDTPGIVPRTDSLQRAGSHLKSGLIEKKARPASSDSLRTPDTRSASLKLSDVSNRLVDIESVDGNVTDTAEGEIKEDVRFVQPRKASMVTTSIYLNLRQPDVKVRWALTFKSLERECLELYLEDAFNGGACLRVNPSDAMNTSQRTSRLFHCDFKCDNMLIVCVVTKAMKNYQDQYLNVRLKMKNANNKDLQVVLLGRNLDLQTSLSSLSVGIHYAYPLHSEDQKEFKTLREYLLVHEPGFYVPIDNFYGWEIRYYKVHVPGSRVIQINCRTELPQGGILLGHLGICHWK